MTKQETAQIMAVLAAAYPRFYINQTEMDKMAAFNLWYRHFADVSYNVMLQAVHAVISTNKFVPTIADINEKIDLILFGGNEELTDGEAWSLVSRAICNSTYNYTEEFSKLPPIIQKTVGSARQLHEWAAMDEMVVHSVIASNFQRDFRTVRERKKQLEYLPERRHELLNECRQIEE